MTFGLGAGAGAATVATGGAGASVWAVAGVAAAGGAVVSANSSIVAQTGANYSGFNQVNWGEVGKSAAVGGVAAGAGGTAGAWASSLNISINGFQHPLMNVAVGSAASSAAGHVAGGTTIGLLEGKSLGTAFYNSFDGIGKNVALGTAMGVSSYVGMSYANGINPLTGKRNRVEVVNSKHSEVLPTQDWLDESQVEFYRNEITNKSSVKPIIGYEQNGKIYIEDGHHRYAAYKSLGIKPNIIIHQRGGPVGFPDWSSTTYQKK